MKCPQALAAEYVFGKPCFAFFQNFANADDGVSPASRAALSLKFTMSSVSPKYCRRSEWPMMACVQPTASSMLGQTSPV